MPLHLISSNETSVDVLKDTYVGCEVDLSQAKLLDYLYGVSVVLLPSKTNANLYCVVEIFKRTGTGIDKERAIEALKRQKIGAIQKN